MSPPLSFAKRGEKKEGKGEGREGEDPPFHHEERLLHASLCDESTHFRVRSECEAEVGERVVDEGVDTESTVKRRRKKKVSLVGSMKKARRVRDDEQLCSALLDAIDRNGQHPKVLFLPRSQWQRKVDVCSSSVRPAAFFDGASVPCVVFDQLRHCCRVEMKKANKDSRRLHAKKRTARSGRRKKPCWFRSRGGSRCREWRPSGGREAMRLGKPSGIGKSGRRWRRC